MMQGMTRKGISLKLHVILAVVLILATFAQVSFSKQCTPKTCPDSPVYVEFMNEDCSGAREYYSFDQPYNECQAKDDEFYRYSYTDEYLDIETYKSPACGAGLKYPTMEIERRHFGRCFGAPVDFARRASKLKIGSSSPKRNSKGGLYGYMWLRNAKQQTSPQPYIYKPGKPWNGDDDIPCKDIQDCASKGLFFRGYFENGCNNPARFRAFNATANICYQSMEANAAYSCLNKHTAIGSMSREDDCSFPYVSFLFGGECGVGNQETVYCPTGASLTETILTQKIGK